MPDTITLLFPSEAPIPIQELYELSALDEIETLSQGGEILGYRLIWEDVRLTISFLEASKQEALIDEFLDMVDNLLEHRRDKKAQKLWRRAERMLQAIQCTVEPDWDESHKAEMMIQGIMVYYDYAFMIADRAVYNANGNIEIGHPESKRKYWLQSQDEEEDPIANERKKRSIEILKKEDIPYIKHLRALPDEDEIMLRSVDEVARRAMLLNLIARFADGESQTWFQQKIQQYRLADILTEQERTFVEDDNPPEYITILFSQRLESFWTLAWALQLVDSLGRPDHFCNAEAAYALLDDRSPDQFLLDAKLRDKTEIMDTLDLHFRYHWAVTDAELYGKRTPGKLEPDVVYQRHYALNWLIQHEEQDWDEVSTNT